MIATEYLIVFVSAVLITIALMAALVAGVEAWLPGINQGLTGFYALVFGETLILQGTQEALLTLEQGVLAAMP